MEAIKQARALGKAIQADERYAEYHAAKEVNDSDEPLQDLIGEFNLVRQQLGLEATKHDDDSTKDKDKIDRLNLQAREIHARIMDNESMKRFTNAKTAMDAMISEVSAIISLCCDGEDPDTCQPVNDCSGGCSSCAKCG
ncbi:MAG: YlbF family regulator [Oscillospiraceae bacterium]|nr:YlbF family regulator [Oscillospiraceae bacterium]